MTPLEILEKEMSKDSFAIARLLIRSGATWDFDEYTNSFGLEYDETPQGLRQFYVIVNMDEETYTVTPAFVEMKETFTVK